jgi:uncharacterized protein
MSTSIPTTVATIKLAADLAMKGVAEPVVTGELKVISDQGEDLIRSEIRSMFLAISLITLLLALFTGTLSFGLISLIPNLPPLAVVFGMMGWLGIPLDGVTVFAATASIGLAAQNTIHFVAQLKRETKIHPELDVEQALFRAYGFAAKPMLSWSLVLLPGFLSLLATPFQAAANFGELVSAAVLLGVFGDLIFLQAIILTFPRVKDVVARHINKEAAMQCTEEIEAEHCLNGACLRGEV